MSRSRGYSGKPHLTTLERVKAGLKARHLADLRYRYYGLLSICISLAFLLLLFLNIIWTGSPAFWRTTIALDVTFDLANPASDGSMSAETLAGFDYLPLIKRSLTEQFPEVKDRESRRQLGQLLSSGADQELRALVESDATVLGSTRRVWLTASDEVDLIVSGAIPKTAPEAERRISTKQLEWLDALAAEGRIERQWNTPFFSRGDSREPERAGIGGAATGSFFTLIVTLVLSFPIGLAAAIYLEEFAPRNAWTDLIEVNINNLAAVPSIVFGLLGLAVFIGVFDMPRSSALVGGLVLSLMTLPTVIIASRSALKSVPPSIREAALGVGASKVQMVLHHVLPLALPGMMTGTIIGMARALGESAPLLMIGMVAFIVDIPNGFTDPATVLPVQIYLWADSPERSFVAKTSAAILVLLVFLVAMNSLAVFLRRKFERRW